MSGSEGEHNGGGSYPRAQKPTVALCLLGPEGPAKIQEVTLMRPIHGNL